MTGARARRILLRALVASAFPLGPVPGFAAQAVSPPPDPWSYRYHACADSEVKDLVGKPREQALARVKDMNLKTLRVLAPDTRVATAPDPQRLTIVIAPNGIVTRAFCR
jgi:hypothetical protein